MSEQTIPESLLSKVRALLAKAEDPAATQAEAEAFTAKATELMAKYGIEQALLADHNPDAGKPADRIITVTNPWGNEKARFAYFLAEAMGCRAILLTSRTTTRVHLFGFTSDLERVELLYTSLLLQMTSLLARVHPPAWESPRAYRRSWILGFRSEVVARVKAAEQRAAEQAQPATTGRSTALVLADRSAMVQQAFTAAYPKVSRGSSRYSGGGYESGRSAGSRANIGQTGIRGGNRAIGGAR